MRAKRDFEVQALKYKLGREVSPRTDFKKIMKEFKTDWKFD